MIPHLITRDTNFWHKIHYLYIVRKRERDFVWKQFHDFFLSSMAPGKRIKKNEPSRKVTLGGRVILKKFGQGSKSEYDAVCLETEHETFVLRRVGGNAFYDEILRSLVGKNITTLGTVNKPYFMMTSFEEKDE